MAKSQAATKGRITTASTAEYFAKNLQQVGFSSPTKAVLTTLKEAVDNALDACEDAGILPDVKVHIERVGPGTLKNSDQVIIRVEDNGPGIDPEDVPKVFGEYLASSKFGRGRCSRGQQGIGISAATTWAMQTTATGARVITKKKGARKAYSCIVDMDLKNNKGIIREKQTVDWVREHGTSVEFRLDGRIQTSGEGGLISYLRGTVLLNPHLRLEWNIVGLSSETVERATSECPEVPDAIEPHPHTMKLGEFMSHARLYGRVKTGAWLRKGFSRVSDATLTQLTTEQKIPRELLNRNVDALSEDDFKSLYAAVSAVKLLAPPTSSVMALGEDALALSIRRMGDIDFFAVLTRKPTIADFKPVQVEVAIARFSVKDADAAESPVQVQRFANRVPLQFDKSACAIVKAITTVNWRSYGLRQPKDALPLGPYVIAVSVVSPFIKFKNASKETIDASDELVEELRRAMIQAGQRLSRYIKREHKAGELEERTQHIEQFGPILIETLGRILNAPETRQAKAREGLAKILERDTTGIKRDLKEAQTRLTSYLEEKKQRLSGFFAAIDSEAEARKRAQTEAQEVAGDDTETLDAGSEGGSEDHGGDGDEAAAAKGKNANKKSRSKKVKPGSVKPKDKTTEDVKEANDGEADDSKANGKKGRRGTKARSGSVRKDAGRSGKGQKARS